MPARGRGTGLLTAWKDTEMSIDNPYGRPQRPATVSDTDVNEALETGRLREGDLDNADIEHDEGAQPQSARKDAPRGYVANTDDRIATLVSDLSSDVSRLVRDELQLAKAELKDKGREAGVGVGLFGGAGTVALYGVAALVAAAILGLAEAIPAWLAALLVAVLLFAVATVVALLGKRHVAGATPPVPEHVVEGVQKDLQALKGHHPDRKA